MDKMKQEKIAEMERAIAADYANIAGMVVLKNGERVYENYFGNCTEDSRIHVFSVTKSVVSVLIGMALDKGYIGRIDQRVLDFYPEYMPKRGEKTLQNITLRDMLTMTAPYKYKATPYTKYFTSEDWVKFSLDALGGKGQIGQFRYAPLIGPDVLAGILTKVTGQSVLYFPMLVFSGTTLPLEVMPRTMQKIVSLFPLTQGITMMKNAFIGADTGSVLLPVCVMLGLTALCTALSVRFFRWE